MKRIILPIITVALYTAIAYFGFNRLTDDPEPINQTYQEAK